MLTIKKVQRKLKNIISAPNKEQDLKHLLGQLEIPITKVESLGFKTLKWPEMYEKAQDWLDKKILDKRTNKMILMALLSAVAAVTAVVFSIYVNRQTNKLLAPTRRPIIAINQSKCEGYLITDSNAINIKMTLYFKNQGKRPAENMRLRTWAAPFNDPTVLKQCTDFTVANTVYPEIQFSRQYTLTVPIKKRAEKIILPDEKLFMYLRLDYFNTYEPQKTYTEYYYLVYKVGKKGASYATLEEKTIFEEYIEKLEIASE